MCCSLNTGMSTGFITICRAAAQNRERRWRKAQREKYGEARAEVEVGPVALLYECAPHRQSGEYDSSPHALNVIFECRLKEGSGPRMPDVPDGMQSAVRWVHLNELDSIVLFPRIQRFIKQFASWRTTVPMINDYELKRYSDG